MSADKFNGALGRNFECAYADAVKKLKKGVGI